MKEIALQRKGTAFLPFSKEDEERMKEYPENQIIKAKTYGITIPRSYEQLKLYFACCQKVADNLDQDNPKNAQWLTKEDVDFQCRVQCKLIDYIRVVRGVAYIQVGSISYGTLSHLQACNYFDRAFEIMAKKIGVTVDELTAEAKQGEI